MPDVRPKHARHRVFIAWPVQQMIGIAVVQDSPPTSSSRQRRERSRHSSQKLSVVERSSVGQFKQLRSDETIALHRTIRSIPCVLCIPQCGQASVTSTIRKCGCPTVEKTDGNATPASAR